MGDDRTATQPSKSHMESRATTRPSKLRSNSFNYLEAERKHDRLQTPLRYLFFWKKKYLIKFLTLTFFFLNQHYDTNSEISIEPLTVCLPFYASNPFNQHRHVISNLPYLQKKNQLFLQKHNPKLFSLISSLPCR